MSHFRPASDRRERSARRWRRLGLIVALLGAAAPTGLRAQDGPEVRGIRFEGAAAFESRTLAAAIVTRQTRCRSVIAQPACLLGFARDIFHLDDEVLRADILRVRLFYYQRGYRDAVVDAQTTPAGRGVRITFRIHEGEPVLVSTLGVAGPPELDVPGLTRRLPIAPGGTFNTITYEATRDTLTARLRNAGYPRAQTLASYLIPADSPYVARVAYELLADELVRFGTIEVRGTEQISARTVRRRLSFTTGDRYSRDEMLQSQRNLFAARVFRHVEIRTDLDQVSEDGTVPVVVQVSEGDLHRMRAGVGLNTADAVNAEVRWANRNFLGGTRRLELSGRIANVLTDPLQQVPLFDTGSGIYGNVTGGVAADFTQPWFLGPRNTGGLGLFVDRRSVPGVYVRTTYGGYVSFTRRLDSRTTGALSYRPELTRLQADGDLLFCVSFVACAFDDIRVLEEPHWLAPLGLSLVRDRSNAILAPTDGYVLRLEAEVADRRIGSEFEHARLLAETSFYQQVSPGVVLASRLRPGWAVPLGEPGDSGTLGLHPQKRFFAGGSNSVRGFPQYQLGPKVLTVDAARVLAAPADRGGAGCVPETIGDGSCDAGALPAQAFRARPVGGAILLEGNVELRFPLYGEHVRGATFLDFGQVWAEGHEVRLSDLVWSPGFGVRYFSPIGPIRVDIGYHASRGALLPVITTTVCRDSDPDCVVVDPTLGLGNTTTLRKLDQDVFWNPRDSFLERFQIHLSIGQAF